VVKEKNQLICIYETKKTEVIEHKLGHALWFFEWKPTENMTGRLLCLWSNDGFHMQKSFMGSGFMEEIWTEGNKRVIIINIYVP